MSSVKMYAFLFILFYFQVNSKAQSINGDTIYVDSGGEISINFPTNPTYWKVNPDQAPYNLKSFGSGFTIIAKQKNTKPAFLEVIEDKRTHHFIIVYKKNINYSNLSETNYDYSNLTKLKDHVKQKEELERNYKITVDAADKAFQDKDYENAKVLYEQALGMQNRPEIKDQLKKVKKLIRKHGRKN